MTFDRSVWDGTKSIVASQFGARSVGPFTMIEPAMEVWSDINAKKDAHDDPLGGIVVEVTTAQFSDGELVRSFRTYDYFLPAHKAFRVIAEADIERDSITAADPGRIVRAIRRMLAPVAKSRKSLWLPEEARLLHDAETLSRTLMGGQW